MGQESGVRYPLFAYLQSLRPERLLIMILLVITLGFGLAYARLLYQQRQALAERDRVMGLVEAEMDRQRDLTMLLNLVEQPWYREAAVVRVFGPRAHAPSAPAPAEAQPAQGTLSASSASEGENTMPVWRQWMNAFHLSGVEGNREPD